MPSQEGPRLRDCPVGECREGAEATSSSGTGPSWREASGFTEKDINPGLGKAGRVSALRVGDSNRFSLRHHCPLYMTDLVPLYAIPFPLGIRCGNTISDIFKEQTDLRKLEGGTYRFRIPYKIPPPFSMAFRLQHWLTTRSFDAHVMCRISRVVWDRRWVRWCGHLRLLNVHSRSQQAEDGGVPE